jgi:hypothetical protein
MKQINSNIIKLASEIEKTYYDLLRIVGDGVNVINKNRATKYMGFYALNCAGYAIEVAVLQSQNWNTSSESLVRDFLESYAIFKKLDLVSNNCNDTDEYIKYLIYIDLYHDKTIFNQISTDKSYVDNEKIDYQLETFLKRFKLYINEYFPEESELIDDSDLRNSTIKIINRLNKKYENQRVDKHVMVGDALIDNSEWTNDNNGVPFEGAYSIYKNLCHATHQNINAIESRLVNRGTGIIIANLPSQNIEALLSITLYCLRDIKNIISIKLRS